MQEHQHQHPPHTHTHTHTATAGEGSEEGVQGHPWACLQVLRGHPDLPESAEVATRHQEALEKFGEGLLYHPRLRHLLPSDVPPPARATRHQNRVAPLRAPRCPLWCEP
ncbi:hypothetical protein E2C01_093066 [Portunus trituberculatus]|uniref:Uncharacterized protein n=1 Tax=Portunus trituberculatus TaxID=210409 RepID=A0A5B7JX57_PORTR|nr:hypothetical protein [Portunus trituberculatus]